ncbi:hypothetical protein SDC9_180186 [bioreactor metagenome]|uniref:Uncharacterized protein n=1 Tax=bioreactor metagenome TaxID=1076179 RepID=A0A645H2K2_9ZZZZ
MLESFTGRTLFGQGKPGTDLYSFGSQCEGRSHPFARCNTSCCDQWQIDSLSHLWNQCEGGGFFTPIMASGLKSFGDDGINAGFSTFNGKFGARHHMGYFYPCLFKFRCPCFWVTGRSENDRYFLLEDDLHDLLNLGVHQRDVYPKRISGSSLAFLNVFT